MNPDCLDSAGFALSLSGERRDTYAQDAARERSRVHARQRSHAALHGGRGGDGSPHPHRLRVHHRPRHTGGQHGCRPHVRRPHAPVRPREPRLRRARRRVRRRGERRLRRQPARRHVRERADVQLLKHRPLLHGRPRDAPDHGRLQRPKLLHDDPSHRRARSHIARVERRRLRGDQRGAVARVRGGNSGARRGHVRPACSR